MHHAGMASFKDTLHANKERKEWLSKVPVQKDNQVNSECLRPAEG